MTRAGFPLPLDEIARRARPAATLRPLQQRRLRRVLGLLHGSAGHLAGIAAVGFALAAWTPPPAAARDGTPPSPHDTAPSAVMVGATAVEDVALARFTAGQQARLAQEVFGLPSTVAVHLLEGEMLEEEPTTMGAYHPASDEIRLHPAYFAEDLNEQMRQARFRTYVHEIVHAFVARHPDEVAQFWHGVPEVADPGTYGYRQPGEAAAEGAAFALHFVVSTRAAHAGVAPYWAAELSRLDATLPGTRRWVDALLTHPRFVGHPLRDPALASLVGTQPHLPPWPWLSPALAPLQSGAARQAAADRFSGPPGPDRANGLWERLRLAVGAETDGTVFTRGDVSASGRYERLAGIIDLVRAGVAHGASAPADLARAQARDAALEAMLQALRTSFDDAEARLAILAAEAQVRTATGDSLGVALVRREAAGIAAATSDARALEIERATTLWLHDRGVAPTGATERIGELGHRALEASWSAGRGRWSPGDDARLLTALDRLPSSLSRVAAGRSVPGAVGRAFQTIRAQLIADVRATVEPAGHSAGGAQGAPRVALARTSR